MLTEECSYEGDDTNGAERRPGPNGEPKPAGKTSAVLIVEDERVARRALHKLLSASGYATEAAESAEEALGLLKDRPVPRVALVDLNLPGMNGIDLIRRLEQLDPAVCAVLMTGAGDEALAAALRDRHVFYLRKPLDFPRLLTLISNSLPCQ